MSAFERTDLPDADLCQVDVDSAKLARRRRSYLPDAPERAGLGEAATWFYRLVLEECCAYYIRLVVHLTPFTAKASAELLGRVSGLSEVHIEDQALLPAITRLRSLSHLRLDLRDVTDLEFLSSPNSPRDIDLSALGDVQLTVTASRGLYRFGGAGRGSG